jgi:hypothetical protein
MQDNMNFLINDSDNFIDYLIDEFTKKAKQKLKEYDSVIPSRLKKKITINWATDLCHCIGQWTRYASQDAAIRRDELIDHVEGYITKRVGSTALTETSWSNDKNNIMHIKHIRVIIKIDALRAFIVNNLQMLPIVVDEFTNVTPCHEIGHVIDHIQTIEGKNYDEYREKIENPDNEELDNYYKWKKEFYKTVDDHDFEGMRLMTQKYYQCQCEARADILGGVDRNAMLDKFFNADTFKRGYVEVRSLSKKEFNKLMTEYKEIRKGDN